MGIYRPVQAGQRLFQGEVVERLLEWAPQYDNDAAPQRIIGVRAIRHDFVIVLSQDCDLEKDWRIRQNQPLAETGLKSVIFCPALPAEELRQQQGLTSKKWEVVRQNKDERYSYLAEIPANADSANEGTGALLLDMMGYFTVRTEEVYRQLRINGADTPRRRCTLETPWAEHLQLRFSIYQCRIGLPCDHFVKESERPQLPDPAAPPPAV